MKIKIGFFSVMLFLSLLITHSYFALASLLAVIIHEIGHIWAAKICRIRLHECTVGIYGAELKPSLINYSYKEEIFLCICGPAINILTSIVLIPAYYISASRFILYLILSSVVLAVLNILPIKDFDGGRILYSFLCLFLLPTAAERMIYITSFLLIFILWTLSVYLLLVSGANLSLFIFSISLFSKIFFEKIS